MSAAKLPHRFRLAIRYHAALIKGGTLASHPEHCAALALRHADALTSLSISHEGMPAPSPAAVTAGNGRAAPAAPGDRPDLFGAQCDVCRRSAPAKYAGFQCALIGGICLGMMLAAPAAPGGQQHG